MKYIKLMVLAGFFTIFLYSYVGAGMAEYSASPTFVTQAVPPNILIVLDDSDTMNELAYKSEDYDGTYYDPYQNFDPTKTYYGYFDSSALYTYLNGQFSKSSTGQWDGNFLNWLTMRRIDVTRKVLAGGKQKPEGNENSTDKLLGADNNQLDYEEQNWKSISSADSYTPDTGETKYYVASGEFCHEDSYNDGSCDSSKNIEIDVSDVSEPHTGILQEFWDQGRFGLMFFNTGNRYEDGSNRIKDGGHIQHKISGPGPNTGLMTSINTHSPDSNTPLAESLYEAIRFFRNSESAYNSGSYSTSFDPIQNWCQKNFVLFLTDGESVDDLNVPGGSFSGADDTSPTVSDSDPDYDLEYYMDEINSTHYNNKLNNEHGSYYLEGLSYYAHTNDLRSDFIKGEQSLSIYNVFAFENSNKAESLLKTSAKYGGFEDKNDNDEPDLQAEWDKNEDGIPDTYYEAQDGSELENKLTSAINDILERASSGTAVSVLATSQEGEGNIVQAYFRPKVTQETRTLEWLGYVHSLWVDSRGNLREDTNDNNALDLTEDDVVRTYTDSSTAETKAKIYEVSSTNKYPDEDEDENATKVDLHKINSIWNAGERLEQTNATDRDIFTYLDQDYDDNDEKVDFKTSNDNAIKPYLGVADDTTSSHLGDTPDERVDNVIDFVRGKEIDGLRTRKMSNGTIWKLGDIVHSTPMVVSGAVENYHTLYGRESYDDYVKDQKDRETMVYVGANDGLLHAFTSWKYDKDAQEYVEPNSTGPNEKIGDEVWAYAPQNLLPHLKWLPDPDYNHVYYVDQKPRVFDAKIRYGNKWGTFVLCGMRLGGKQITAEGDFDGDTISEDREFNSAYFLLDVTEPRNPKVMWERSYEGLNLTTSRPAIMRVQGEWYAIFGSGPEDYDGTSSSTGKMYVVDLETGEPMGSGNDWLAATDEGNAFMGSPVAFDRATNYNVDTAYIGVTHDETDGKLYKLAVPVTDASGASGDYDLQPSNYEPDPGNWKWKTLFDPEGDRPITAAPSISIDKKDNVWIYGGTGRYFREADKTNTDTQILFGIKDPFYNQGSDNYHEYDFDSLDTGSSLEDVSGIRVTSEGVVYDGDNLYQGDDGDADGEWDSLVSDVESDDGWFFDLDETGERILEKPTVLGGVVMTPSFIPNEDVCGYGGDSNLYAVYYTTGTAYTEPIIGTRNATIDSDNVEVNKKVLSLDTGKASSVSMHVGEEEGATGIIQESTGNIEEVDVNPAMDIKSGILYWKAE